MLTIYSKHKTKEENDIATKIIATIEYLRSETAQLEVYANNESDVSNEELELLKAFKLVLEFVEDCSEDYLEDVKEF